MDIDGMVEIGSLPTLLNREWTDILQNKCMGDSYRTYHTPSLCNSCRQTQNARSSVRLAGWNVPMPTCTRTISEGRNTGRCFGLRDH